MEFALNSVVFVVVIQLP